ncbi:MAG: hypothetical protein HQK79_19895 [Desulfobacterales bacterium]|nr:hypothetical protein [Desulfobacterales bacterium]
MPKYQNPYHFVRNLPINDKILQTVVLHNENKSELLSGEIKVELTCLTPFFTGAERYIKKNTGFIKKKANDEEHTWIVPLTYPETSPSDINFDNKQFLISPQTLKGIYGNLIDKLTCSRMKRVAEMDQGINFRLISNPNKVKAGKLEKNNEEYKILIADKFSFKFQRDWEKVKYNYNHYGYSKIFLKFNKNQKKLTIPLNVVEIYEKTWQRVHKDNPRKKIDRPILEHGMAIFYLTNNKGEVVAISPNFRIKWPFRDTILYHNTFDPQCLNHKKKREQLGYAKTEALKKDTKLSPRQKLFGYTLDDECIHPEQKKDEYLPAYAGRVHFNFAVHVKGTGSIDNTPLRLRILGKPQPTSYENYLSPKNKSGESKISDYGLPIFDEKGGDLAGRKHYLHNPLIDINNIMDKEESTQNSTLIGYLKPDFSNIKAAFPKFRFTVRFEKLEPYELGMLLLILDISHTNDSEIEKIFNILKNKNIDNLNVMNILALKMGYARPLGFGSILSNVSSANIWSSINRESANSPKSIDNNETESYKRQFFQKLKDWFGPSVNTDNFWNRPTSYHLKDLNTLLLFRCHEKFSEVEFNYPHGDKGMIFNHHMNVHKKHIDLRFSDQSNSNPTLSPSPFPQVSKIWNLFIEEQAQTRSHRNFNSHSSQNKKEKYSSIAAAFAEANNHNKSKKDGKK